jgi:hypothetical protein
MDSRKRSLIQEHQATRFEKEKKPMSSGVIQRFSSGAEPTGWYIGTWPGPCIMMAEF